MTIGLGGWGEEWGSTFWGDNHDSNLELLAADALRENVIRLVFNKAPLFSGFADATDAFRANRYTVTPVFGTVGRDGLPARSVFVLYATQALDEDPLGRLVDITVDRALSPHPSAYTVLINGLVTEDGGNPIDPLFAAITFLGLSRVIVPATPEDAYASRDFANPQTLASLLEQAGTTDPKQLGTYVIDSTGDYANDTGLLNLKKRIFRRLITAKGAFLHAPEYGLGAGTRLKRLNTATEREALATEAELQIAQEPDVQKVKVRVIQDSANPSVARFLVLVRTTQGLVEKFDVPFSAV